MHQCRIVAQISLILSIFNLVLAAPIVMREIHGVRHDDAAEDMRQPSSLSDGSTSSGYPTPYLSEGRSESGNSWLLDRPPRLNLDDSVSYHLSGSGSSERPSSLPLLLQGLPSPHDSDFSIPGSPEIPPFPALPSPGSDRAATETHSPPERDMPSHHSSGLAPSHNSISEVSPPTETPQGIARFLNKNMMKTLGIVIGVAAVGGAIGGIVGSQIKHRDHQDR